MADETFFPSLITALPRADEAGDPVRTYFLQGERMQVAFAAFDADVTAPEEATGALRCNGSLNAQARSCPGRQSAVSSSSTDAAWGAASALIVRLLARAALAGSTIL